MAPDDKGRHDKTPFWPNTFAASAIVAATILAPALAIFRPELTAAPWVVLVAGTLAALFTRLDRIAEFTLGPLKARMRETLAETTASLEQLRSLAGAVGEALVLAHAGSWFMSGAPFETRQASIGRVLALLEQLGFSASERERIEGPWRGIACLRFFTRLRAEMRKAPPPWSQAQYDSFEALADFKAFRAPTPSALRDFLRGQQLETPERSEVINAYERFLQTGAMPSDSTFWGTH